MLKLHQKLISPRLARAVQVSCLGNRYFSGYEGRMVTDSDLVKGSDDWAVEETNFCLGRVGQIRFREEDDLARRTLMLIDSQLNAMHTRLRDGTCVPPAMFNLDMVIDLPAQRHTFVERPLMKLTWDETYDDAYDTDEEIAELPPKKAAAKAAAEAQAAANSKLY
eukprot:Platyproteum_vivax@DN1436_c0_g1_i1.p1